MEIRDQGILYVYAIQMMAAGQEDFTEVISMEGKLTVNLNTLYYFVYPQEKTIVRREILEGYYGNVHERVRDGGECVHGVLLGRDEVTLESAGLCKRWPFALRCGRVWLATTGSDLMRTGRRG